MQSISKSDQGEKGIWKTYNWIRRIESAHILSKRLDIRRKHNARPKSDVISARENDVAKREKRRE